MAFVLKLLLAVLWISVVCNYFGFAKRTAAHLQCLTSPTTTLQYNEFCDGKFDCSDLSDEFLCSKMQIRYKNRLQYIVARYRLKNDDFIEDSAVELSKRMCIPYLDTSWRVDACRYCNSTDFLCDPLDIAGKDSACVAISKICDGNMDCPNAEDERFCAEGLMNKSGHGSPTKVLRPNRALQAKLKGNFSSNKVDDISTHDEAVKWLSTTPVSCGRIRFLTKLFKNRFGAMLNTWLATDLRRTSLNSSSVNSNFPSRFGPIRSTMMEQLMLLFNSSNLFQDFIRNPNQFSSFNTDPLKSLSMDGNDSDNQDLVNALPKTFNSITSKILSPLEGETSSPFIQLFQLCDGVSDCSDSSDELYCPGKFYCKNKKPLYVEKSQMMDGVADCSDVSDEWLESPIRHRLSSKNSLIESWVLQVLVWVIGIVALIGNLIVIICTIVSIVNVKCSLAKYAFKRKRLQSQNNGSGASQGSGGNRLFQRKPNVSKRSRLVRTWNSILVLNLATADLLMGVYLTWLAAVSSVFEGRSGKQPAQFQYWNFDRKWRTGVSCNVLGIMLVVSSQTSVFTLIALTSLRLFTVLKPFACYRLKFKYLALTCCLTWIISIILAVMPVVPAFENSFVKEAFVSLPQIHPPDLNKTLAEELVREITILTNITISPFSESLSWSTMFGYMQQTAPQYSNWKFYGYYSEDSVCMPKLFVNPKEDTFWGYTLTLIIINCASVVYIAVAYVMICLRSAKKKMKVHFKSKKDFDRSTTKVEPNPRVISVPQCSETESSCQKSSHCSKKILHQRSTQSKTKSERNLRQRSKRTIEIQQRVALLVATDCVCWVPICVMGFISVAGYAIPQTAYAITAVGLLPINSALNPILYSRFMRSLWIKCWSTLQIKNTASFHSVFPPEKAISDKSTTKN